MPAKGSGAISDMDSVGKSHIKASESQDLPNKIWILSRISKFLHGDRAHHRCFINDEMIGIAQRPRERASEM